MMQEERNVCETRAEGRHAKRRGTDGCNLTIHKIRQEMLLWFLHRIAQHHGTTACCASKEYRGFSLWMDGTVERLEHVVSKSTARDSDNWQSLSLSVYATNFTCCFVRIRHVISHIKETPNEGLRDQGAVWNHHHHSVICLTTGPKPPPKRCLHIVRSRASSFKWEYPLLSLTLRLPD